MHWPYPSKCLSRTYPLLPAIVYHIKQLKRWSSPFMVLECAFDSVRSPFPAVIPPRFLCRPWQSMKRWQVPDSGKKLLSKSQKISVFSTWFSHWVQSTALGKLLGREPTPSQLKSGHERGFFCFNVKCSLDGCFYF